MWRANWRQSVNNGTCITAGAFFFFAGNYGRGKSRESDFLAPFFPPRHPDCTPSVCVMELNIKGVRMADLLTCLFGVLLTGGKKDHKGVESG